MAHTRFGRALLTIALVTALGACGPEDPVLMSTEDEAREHFNRHLVMLDGALTDAEALDREAIQALLDQTPWGTRSALATHVSHGRTAAEAIRDAAIAHGINPLAILARAQLEQSLLGKSTASRAKLDWAMGCGCPDGGECISSFRGFDVQVECMAGKLREYLDGLDVKGETMSGWRVGKPKHTLDGYSVTPRNAATAAMYTYTPWVAANQSHLTIWRMLAEHIGYEAPGAGGCGVATFPSSARLQLVPALALTEQYEGADVPLCFIDADGLYDPVTFASYDASVELAPNFRLSEFVGRASSRKLLLDPALVHTLQRVRSAVKRSVNIRLAYQSPDALDLSCAGSGALSSAPSCESPRELAYGTAALVTSNAGRDALLSAAANASVPSCWVEGDAVYIGVGSHRGCPR